ncbi:MAG: 6,7-dimethyl-8-ribityllumazine synthase [Myxococcota bacterium]|jgi:6,7-dimethyl-8-ribityllumazine synthase
MQKILIVQAPFYQKISQMLLEGAIAQAKNHQLEYEIIDVLGAFEIPAAISFASKSKKYDGYLALGCVIRGETTHYDYVCQTSAQGLNELGYKENLAIGYGIITCENEDQAIARADLNQKDKGGFAVRACLKMMELQKKFIK